MPGYDRTPYESDGLSPEAVYDHTEWDLGDGRDLYRVLTVLAVGLYQGHLLRIVCIDVLRNALHLDSVPLA